MQKYPISISQRWEDFVQRRTCLNKRRFATEQVCVDSIAKNYSLFPLRAYKCPFGNHWHKTKHKGTISGSTENVRAVGAD